MTQIEQEFKVRDVTDSPSYYLGNDLKKTQSGRFHISSGKYSTEIVRRYEMKYGPIRKEKTPLANKEHPETDDSEPLDEPGVKEYQHIIGVCQWLVIAGRFDLNYAVSSLSRFSSAPRQGHLTLAKKIMGYLKKYPRRGYVVNPDPPLIDPEYEQVKLPNDFGNQYSYFREDLDPRFPPPIIKELELTVFCDSDHGHDKKTGRSITGIIIFAGSTPIYWESKRQTSVQTSTFGAELTALKRAVEEAVSIRYHLRSLGVAITKPTPIYVDNMGVVLNCTNPASPLNKKMTALAYHFVREHQANKVIEIRKIRSEDNYADPFTKALTNEDFHGFFRNILTN